MPNLLRQILFACVLALPLLVVVYAVVMGGAALLAALGDPAGSLGLRWAGTVLAVLFASAAMVLMFLLGWSRLQDEE